MKGIADKKLRPIELKSGFVSQASNLRTGYFHRWCAEPVYTDIDPVMTKTYGLVELSDGSVCMVEPIQIKFINE